MLGLLHAPRPLEEQEKASR